MDRKEYEKIDKLSYSQLKCALKTKREYQYNWEQNRAESSSIDIGKAFHAKIREEFGDYEQEFSLNYMVMDEELRFKEALNEPNFRKTKEYQDWKKQCLAQAELRNLTLCDPIVLRMIEANKDELESLFAGKGYTFEETIVGSESKGILDCYKVFEDKTIVVDFKTTSNIERFVIDARYKYHLDIQAYNYKNLILEKYPQQKDKPFRFYWLVFSTVAPYVAELIQVPEEAFLTGKEKYEQAKKSMAEWQKPDFKQSIILNNNARW